ncbi:MAG: DUF3810 domain-containing protein [Oscillospiraceae bacterium]|nr:DUF3810 domain-containing protein [Oscillospiraceae bacterium]
MKYWRGYLTAAIFAAISWVLMQFGSKFTTIVDMVYPYVIRTLQDMLAEWTGSVDFVLWQMIAMVLLVILVASIVLMIVLKWNPIQWFGWVLTACSVIFMLHTLVYGLNYYAGPITEDIRLEEREYSVEDLTQAATYYRDKANDLAGQVHRDSSGNVEFSDFEVLAEQAADGFESLVYDHSYPVFAGSNLPVKELGWADLYSSMGIDGVTMGLTGEAAVNPQIPDVALPFTMCHEMAHRKCIAIERDANFSAFLACQANDSVEFQYSAYFMAYRYCYNALAGANTTEAAGAAARVANGVSAQLSADLKHYSEFYSSKRSGAATSVANTANDVYLKASGNESGIASYGEVCDLLVWWHYQEVFLPAVTVEESHFDPMDESQVDLSGNVNAKETEPVEEGVG